MRKHSAKIRKIAVPTPATATPSKPPPLPQPITRPMSLPLARALAKSPTTEKPTVRPPMPTPSTPKSTPPSLRLRPSSIRERLQDTQDEPLPPVLDPSVLAKAIERASEPSPPTAPAPVSTPPSEAMPTIPAPPEPETEREPEPEPEPATVPEEPASTRRSGPRWALRLALLFVIVGGELAFAHRTGMLELPKNLGDARAMFVMAMHARTTESASPAPAAEGVNAPNTDVLADPNASRGSDAIDIPSNMGLLTTTDAKPGHRIFVDERTVGQTPGAVLVKCGPATVKLGSAGRAQSIDVPCGEPIAVEDR